MRYDIYTGSEKLVSDYTGLDIMQVLDMEFDLYKLLYRDAYIYQLSKTEQGREYLENAWILTQSKPDRKALRRHFQEGSG